MSTNPSTSSGSLAVGTTTVQSLPGRFFGAVLNPGSAASSVTVYDNASAASGTVLLQILAPASGSSDSVIFNAGVVCNNGVTVVVAGTGATATVYSHTGA